MKKLLLSMALCGLATSAFAQEGLMNFDECFAISYEGQTVENGATLKATKFEDVSDLYGDGTVTYSLDLKVENLDITSQYMRGVLKASKPTMKEYLSNRYFWGDPQLCYIVQTPEGPSGNCLSGDPNNQFNPSFGYGNLRIPVNEEFEWQIHVVGCEVASNGIYQLTLQGVEVDNPNDMTNYTVTSTPFEIYLDFSAASLGVNEIESDDLNGVYYDLQGRRVANPSKGLYIYKTAGKAEKRLIK
ncbi:MAG: hypothetical protein K2M31_05370 [Muribaculaceae bacterium]|nr:hypothetical protein [Muribaculaceae bacterium]